MEAAGLAGRGDVTFPADASEHCEDEPTDDDCPECQSDGGSQHGSSDDDGPAYRSRGGSQHGSSVDDDPECQSHDKSKRRRVGQIR